MGGFFLGNSGSTYLSSNLLGKEWNFYLKKCNSCLLLTCDYVNGDDDDYDDDVFQGGINWTHFLNPFRQSFPLQPHLLVTSQMENG